MAAPHGSFDWTHERVVLATQRWAANISAPNIAAELGDGATKGAVSAKLKRLGLNKTNRTKSQKGLDLVTAQRIQAKARKKETPTLPDELPADAIPMAQRKQLIELKMGDCKYPYGTPGKADFFFCGAEALAAKPYCAFHFRHCCPGMRH